METLAINADAPASRRTIRFQSPEGVSFDVVRECKEALHRLQERVDGLDAAGVVGPDGFEVAAISGRTLEAAKASALASTLLAVADAFLIDCGLKECRELILKSENGTGVLLGIPVGSSNYGLFVILRKDTPLGVVLYQSKHCVREVAAALSA